MGPTEEIFILIKDFCKFLPIHIEKWEDVLPLLIKKVQGVANLSEQLRGVSRANIEYMSNFPTIQECLKVIILKHIEEDMKFVRDSIDKLSRFNTQLRDKLEKLETLSLQLNWDNEASEVLNGSPLIPPLGILLQESLAFYTFFNIAHRNMHTFTKGLQLMDEENMKMWEDTFCIHLRNKTVNRLISITQYTVDGVVLK